MNYRLSSLPIINSKNNYLQISPLSKKRRPLEEDLTFSLRGLFRRPIRCGHDDSDREYSESNPPSCENDPCPRDAPSEPDSCSNYEPPYFDPSV